jgi:hypothetical protein
MNGFPVIILRFFIQKFLKTKKFFQKYLEKLSATGNENLKTSNRRRREQRRLTPLVTGKGVRDSQAHIMTLAKTKLSVRRV